MNRQAGLTVGIYLAQPNKNLVGSATKYQPPHKSLFSKSDHLLSCVPILTAFLANRSTKNYKKMILQAILNVSC